MVALLQKIFGPHEEFDVDVSVHDGIARIIAQQKRRKEEERKHREWSGNLLNYSYLVSEYPQAAETARERAWRVLFHDPGYRLLTHENDSRRARMLGVPEGGAFRIWNTFDEFIYIYPAIDRIAGFFENAARGGEKARQIPFLLGDTGTGKSQFVSKIFKVMVGQTFYHIEGCPMHEHPFRALPLHDRLELQEILDRSIDLEGDLCTHCSYWMQKKWKDWRKVPVTTSRLSVRRRIGLVTLYPVDPNNQDIRALVGAEAMSKLLKFEEGHPLLGNLAGAGDQAEGGFLELPELTMNPPDFLHVLIGQTQEKLLPAPGFYGNVSSDAIVIAHSNWEPHDAFMALGKNVAIRDRIVQIMVPYVLSYQDVAERLYPKMLSRAQKSGVHFSPLALEAAARFQVVSARQREQPEGNEADVPLDAWVELRNGTKMQATRDVRYLNGAFPKDGHKGVSPRLSVKALEACESDLAIGYGRTRNPKHKCVSPERVIDELIPEVRFFYDGPRLDEIRKDNLDTLRTYVPRILKQRTQDILSVLLQQPSVQERLALALVDALSGIAVRYLEFIRREQERARWLGSGKEEGEGPEKPTDEDYSFLDRIESRLGLSLEARPQFRAEIIRFAKEAEERGNPFDLSQHPKLCEVLSSIFFEQSHGKFEKLFARMQEDKALVRFLCKELNRLAKKRDDDQEGVGVLNLPWCPACTLKLVSYAATREWQS